MLFDRFQEAFVGGQFLVGVSIADPGLVYVGFRVIEIVLEQRFRLLLVRVHECAGDLFFEQVEIFLVQGILEEFEVLLARVVGQVALLGHRDERLAHVDRIDAVAGDIVGERVVERLHDEAGRYSRHPFALGVFFQLLHVDFLGASFFDDFLAIVEAQLGHQIALRSRLEAGEDRIHGGELESVRRDVGAEVGVLDDLLIDLHFFRQAQVVRDLDHDDTIEDRLVGVIGLELLPFGFVRMRDDAGIDVDHPVASRCRNDFFLGRRDHRVQILGLVLENFDKLDDAAVADVERSVELEHARVAFRILIEFRDIFRSDQHRSVLIVRIDRRNHADADAISLGEGARGDRKFLVAVVELGSQPVAADRAQVAFDMRPEHLFEFAAQMTRNQMQRLLVHRASFDRVDHPDLLESALDPLDQRALAGADRTHQVEDLAALFALERSGMEVTDNLRDGALDAEEFFGEKIKDLERLILVEPFGARIVGIMQWMQAQRNDQIVNARMSEFGHDRVGLHQLEILEQRAAPLLGLARGAVFFDHSLEVVEIRHRLSPSG